MGKVTRKTRVSGMGAVLGMQLLQSFQSSSQHRQVTRSLSGIKSSVDAANDAIERVEETNNKILAVSERQLDVQEEALAVHKRAELRDLARDQKLDMERALKGLVFNLRKEVEEFSKIGAALPSFVLLQGTRNLARDLGSAFDQLHSFEDKEYLHSTLKELDEAIDTATERLSLDDETELQDLNNILTSKPVFETITAPTEDTPLAIEAPDTLATPKRRVRPILHGVILFFTSFILIGLLGSPEDESNVLDAILVIVFLVSVGMIIFGLIKLIFTKAGKGAAKGRSKREFRKQLRDIELENNRREADAIEDHKAKRREKVAAWIRKHDPLGKYIGPRAFLEPIEA